MLLRNFLFLDTRALDDYLSTLVGMIVEGPVDQIEIEKRDKGGKVTARVVEGSLSSTGSTETKRKLATTEAAKFQQLYDLLSEADDDRNRVQYLEAFDESIWHQLRRGEVLEVVASIRIPQAVSMFRVVDDIAPLLNVMTAIGQDPFSDPQTRVGFEAVRTLGQAVEEKPVPLLFQAVGSPGFRFLANLSRQYLRVGVSELQGEATVIGTIQRIIPRGQQHEAFNILPMSLSSIPGTKQVQYQKGLREMAQRGYAEILKGPAMIVTPLAIYR